MTTYGQFCPVARASEVLAERWTLIVVRNLLYGCETFGELLEGAPRIPRSVLTDRLRKLQRSGVLERRSAGSRSTYHLTECGRDLGMVCDALAEWGSRWLETREEHLDAQLALWFWTRGVDAEQLPDKPVVIRFDLVDGSRPDRYWVVLSRQESEVCVHDPGPPEDLVVRTDTRWLVRWQTGEVSLGKAIRAGGMEFSGPRTLVRSLERWGGLSRYRNVHPIGAAS